MGLGANVGDPEANLRHAVGVLRRIVDVRRISSLYRTAPVGPVAQPLFLNAVLGGDTDLTPRELITVFRKIEDEAGRTRGLPMGPRTLDLDLLLYGARVVDEDDVQVPHPRMEARRFVLEPLAEIAPDVVHPASGRTARELLVRLGGDEAVVRLTVEDWPPG